jgi:hypothetical protein
VVSADVPRYGERPKSRLPEPAFESVLLSRLSGSIAPGSSGFTGRVGGTVFPAVPGGGNGSVGVAAFGAALFGVALFGVALFGVALFGVALFGVALFGVALFGVALFGVALFGVVVLGVVVLGVVVFGAVFGAALGAVSELDGAGCAHGSFGFARRRGVLSVPAGAAGCAHGSLPVAAPAAPGESCGGAFDAREAGSVCSTGIALGCTLLLRSRPVHAPSAVATTNAERTSQ